jgi:hypothetical protein
MLNNEPVADGVGDCIGHWNGGGSVSIERGESEYRSSNPQRRSTTTDPDVGSATTGVGTIEFPANYCLVIPFHRVDDVVVMTFRRRNYVDVTWPRVGNIIVCVLVLVDDHRFDQ